MQRHYWKIIKDCQTKGDELQYHPDGCAFVYFMPPLILGSGRTIANTWLSGMRAARRVSHEPIER